MNRPIDPAAAQALTRAGVQARYRAVRAASTALAATLTAEDQQIQSMPDVSPTKWHLAHTSWFFETFVLAAGDPGYAVVDARFGFLFNSYYEAIGARVKRSERGLMSRPTLADVIAYRARVDEAMEALITQASPAVWARLAAVIELGLQHEQQHQELLLMDIKHVLSCNPLQPAYADPPGPVGGPALPMGWRAFAGGLVWIGHDGRGFAFDNEGPRHQVWLEPFELADRLVTCGEYRDFISDGGYRQAGHWLADGWAAVQEHGWQAPLYWQQQDGQWSVFTLHGRRALADAQPVVHLSFYEADAYARWAGRRLPREAEWEHAAGSTPAGPGGEGHGLHPHPAVAGGGLRQLTGAAWQFTASPYSGYPGFRPDPGAIGEYNGKFMINQIVLRGGACITPPGHARATYRNFFPPAARWMVGGVRLAA